MNSANSQVKFDRSTFERLIAVAMDELPEQYVKSLNNVVIVLEEAPTPKQRRQLKLHCNSLLFGLYEGVPLTLRGTGISMLPPDKISLFMQALSDISEDTAQLKAHIKRTLWHEIAHHYGLDHDRIHALEKKLM